ncbi:hypothetical protein CK203_110742 [Vitis vinifera]|uniref:Uncharacterized protein n=1 Tax=Vitis vinifera TaxID=29760 RepID=A0A438CQI3_VITVI|nr:hypothetical protein CK203_110742 [Vitis vinifera]
MEMGKGRLVAVAVTCEILASVHSSNTNNGTEGLWAEIAQTDYVGPLSSYLFVLAMEALSCFVKRAKERGYLLGGLRSGVEAVRKWKCSICFLLMISLYFVRFLKLRLPTYGGRASDYLLGSSLGASYKLEAACKGKEEWFRKRLSTWKRQYISNMETYFDPKLFNLLIYFWEGGALEKKPHLEKGLIVCTTKRRLKAIHKE